MTRANVSYWRISEVPPGCLQRHASQDYRGLTLEAIENVPFYFYKKIALGLPDYEEQLQNYCETVRNLGRAGIPVLGYHFMGNRVWRTSKGEHAR
jgi:mannonate dehydratase